MSRRKVANGSRVEVYNDNFDKALRTFKKKIMESGKLLELREKEFYEKPSITKRKTKNQQVRRAKKRLQSESLPKRLY